MKRYKQNSRFLKKPQKCELIKTLSFIEFGGLGFGVVSLKPFGPANCMHFIHLFHLSSAVSLQSGLSIFAFGIAIEILFDDRYYGDRCFC
jgi:hypothetical protein